MLVAAFSSSYVSLSFVTCCVASITAYRPGDGYAGSSSRPATKAEPSEAYDPMDIDSDFHRRKQRKNAVDYSQFYPTMLPFKPPDQEMFSDEQQVSAAGACLAVHDNTLSSLFQNRLYLGF